MGDFINQHYLSVKINGDSLEGKRLREEYHYPGYPTVILFDPAGNEIDRLIGFDPEQKDEYVQTLLDYTAGRGTLADCLKRLEQDPENGEYNYQVAKKYFERAAYQSARPYILKVIDLDKTRQAEAQYMLAYGEAQLQQNVRPLLSYTKVATDSTWLRQAFLDIARFYRRQKQVDKVLATYEAALQRLPRDTQLMNTYAWYIFQNEVQSAYARGIAVARRAVQLAPEVDGIWDTLGQLLFAAGDIKGAIAAMQRAAELNPKETSYQENLQKYKAALIASQPS